MDFKLGSLVTYRRRSWILADLEGSVLYLRPLGGGDGESLPVHLDLLVALKDTLPHESLSPASFPPPPPSPLASPQELSLLAPSFALSTSGELSRLLGRHLRHLRRSLLPGS